MDKTGRLQQRIESLQKSWKRINNKIDLLRNQSDFETRAEEKLRMEANIMESISELNKIESEINELEKQISPQPERNNQNQTFDKSVALKKFIYHKLKNASVKVFIANEFQGSGFFITYDGYILTAYHCVGEYPPEIKIETRFDGKFIAQFDEEKSLKHFDIAVLKIDYHTSHCLPLGIISDKHITDNVVSVGYPAGHRADNQEIGFYFGKISRFRTDNKFENDAIRGQGQSGAPVYHYATNRVVGLALQGYKSEIMTNTGLATRFEPLFENWFELETINNKVIASFEEYIAKTIT